MRRPPLENVVDNFIALRGVEKLEEFLALLVAGESLASVGRKFDLTRERVRQLSDLLVERFTYVRPKPEIDTLIAKHKKANKPKTKTKAKKKEEVQE